MVAYHKRKRMITSPSAGCCLVTSSLLLAVFVGRIVPRKALLDRRKEGCDVSCSSNESMRLHIPYTILSISVLIESMSYMTLYCQELKTQHFEYGPASRNDSCPCNDVNSGKHTPATHPVSQSRRYPASPLELLLCACQPPPSRIRPLRL